MKENKDVARGWIRKAESDIENLTTMMESGKALDTACFHAQQADKIAADYPTTPIL